MNERPARIVDVGAKDVTEREAVAEAMLVTTPEACERLLSANPKGDAIEAARVAALLAIKRTPELLPFCHPVALVGAEVQVEPDARSGCVRVMVTVRALDRTGVEMEALTGASIGALSLYDTAKAYDRAATITDIRLVSKRGGNSGDYELVTRPSRGGPSAGSR